VACRQCDIGKKPYRVAGRGEGVWEHSLPPGSDITTEAEQCGNAPTLEAEWQARRQIKFTVQIDPEEQPDAVGEHLRREFFQHDAPGTVGCCDTFDWKHGVKELPDEQIAAHNHAPEEETDALCDGCLYKGLQWKRGEKAILLDTGWNAAIIECRYWWDGDGTLAFRLPNGMWLINEDCKKRSGWSLSEDLREELL
jgi:hypothetical protein